MAQSTTTIESVWAAKGNLPDNAIVATADGKYPALDGSLITNVGAGDLLSANNLSELTATASVARTNLELGATDTVEFGGLVPPTGTTAEIAAIFASSLATPDAVYYDREAGVQWQALTSSTGQIVSPTTPVSSIIDGATTQVDSTADAPFSATSIDFDLNTLEVGENAQFELEIYFQVSHSGSNFPLTKLFMDVGVRSEIGSLGFGFPSFPASYTLKGSLVATGPTNLIAASAPSTLMGGFGTDKINGASYPYNDYPAVLLGIADATATTSYLTYSAKQRLTITRTAADFPVAWPMSLSFRVNTAAASPEYISFAGSKVWWKRIDI
jgi:hypothetical protein